MVESSRHTRTHRLTYRPCYICSNRPHYMLCIAMCEFMLWAHADLLYSCLLLVSKIMMLHSRSLDVNASYLQIVSAIYRLSLQWTFNHHFVIYGYCWLGQLMHDCTFLLPSRKSQNHLMDFCRCWVVLISNFCCCWLVLISILMDDFACLQNIHGIFSSVLSIRIWRYFCFCQVTLIHHHIHQN